jgi:hypothetical protein
MVKRGRNDSTVPQDAEKPLAARIASVSREIQQTFHGDHSSILHTLARNVLQVKISALGAVGIACEGYRHAITAKSAVACVTSPGLEFDQRVEKVGYPASMRPETVRAAALRTDHWPGSPRGPNRKNIQFPCVRQDSDTLWIGAIASLSGVEYPGEDLNARLHRCTRTRRN